MKYFLFISFIFLFNGTTTAQIIIKATEAAKYPGQNVHVTATVTRIQEVKSSNSIILGLSNGRDQQQALTLIVHQEQYSPIYSNWLLGLKYKVVSFTGKVSMDHGQPVIKGEAKNTGINTVEILSGRIAPVITTISAKNAGHYIGKQVAVCDTAYDYKFSSDSVFISIGAIYPHQVLTLVASRRFISRPDTMQGKPVCFEGIIILYQDKPRVLVTGWHQNRQRTR